MPHEIMSYEMWMDETRRGILKPRSKELGLVDSALKQYHKSKSDGALEALSTALESWLVKKGEGWKSNERNRHRAVENLRAQINDIDPSAEETLKLLAELPFYGLEMRADQEARDFIREHRRTFIVTLFAGKKLETKSGVRQKESIEASESIATVSRGGTTLASAAGAASSGKAAQLVRSIVGDAFQGAADVETAIAEISTQVLPGFVTQFIAAATPYVGVATAGAKTVYDLGNAVTAQWRSYCVEGHKQSVLAGDPAAAADAIQRLIERERSQHLRNAGIHATSATARALLLAIPGSEAVGGPVIGGAEAFACLVHQIYLVGRDWREKSRANAILERPNEIDLKVFDVCPVLGCYLILCSDDSNVANLLVEDFGWPGWKESVTRMIVNHVRPLREQANRLVNDSRYQIAGLSGFAHVRRPPSKIEKLTSRLKALESLGSVVQDVGGAIVA